MKKLSQACFQSISSWIHRNARSVDLALWKYYFEGGSQDNVITALRFYQNEDGGFGHGIEPDNLNPNSSPFMINMADGYLSAVNFHDKTHPLMRGIFSFLESGVYCSKKGWSWSIPSNNNYPCQDYYLYPNAPWYPEGAVSAGDVTVNLGLIRFVAVSYDTNTELYRKVLKIAGYYIDLLKKSAIDLSVMGPIEQGMVIDHYLFFIEYLKKSQLGELFDAEAVYIDLRKLASGNHSERFERYDNKEDIGCIDSELDGIVDRLQQGGIWSEEGLRCDMPMEKYNEVIGSNVIYWTMSSVMSDMRRLQQAGRLDGINEEV